MRYFDMTLASEWFEQDGWPSLASTIDRLDCEASFKQNSEEAGYSTVYLIGEVKLSRYLTAGQMNTLAKENGFYVQDGKKFTFV